MPRTRLLVGHRSAALLLALAGMLAFATSALARPLGGGAGRTLSVPPIVISPGSIDFGTTNIAGTGASYQSFSVTNTTEQSIAVFGWAGADGYVFFQPEDNNSALLPGETRSYEVGFDPQQGGNYDTTALFSTEAGTFGLQLYGFAQPGGDIDLNPGDVDLGERPIGESIDVSVTVSNPGAASIEIQEPAFDTGGSFTITSDVSASFTLGPGEERIVHLTVTPDSYGEQFGTVTFTSASGTIDRVMSIGMVGRQAVLEAAPSTLDFGAVTTGTTVTLPVTFTNTGDYPATPTSLSIGSVPGVAGSGDFSATLPSTDPIQPGGSITIQVSFAPTGAGARSGTLDLVARGAGPFSWSAYVVGEGQIPSGQFSFASRPVDTSGATPTEVATGDVNGDGKLDLAAGFASTGRVATALGNGDGTFQALATLVDPNAAQTDMGLTTADLNGDGYADLIVAGQSGVSVYRGTASGTLTLAANAATGATRDVAAIDIDLDGKLDLVLLDVRTSTPKLRVLRGDGFSFTSVGTLNVRNAPRELVVGDFNGLGISDILLGDEPGRSTTVQIIRPLAQGPLGTVPIDQVLSVQDGPAVAPQAPRSIGVGQFDGDGWNDLTTGGTLSLGGDGTGEFIPTSYRSPVQTGLAPSQALAVADFNGDGRDDQALTSNGTPDLLLQPAGNAGQMGAATSIDLGASSGSASADMITADLNGDGRPDLITAKGGAKVDVLVNAGTTPVPAGPNRAIVRELRPGSGAYASIHNPSRTDRLRLGGWQLRFPGGGRFTLPSWLQLPPRATVLLRTTGYASTGEPSFVLGIAPYFVAAIPAGVQGVALVDPSGATVDAVGSTVAPAGFREGAGLPAQTLGQYGAFQRRDERGGSVDTGDNSADFIPINPQAAEGDGSILGIPDMRLVPLATNRNDFLQSSLWDPSQPASAAPNRQRVGDQLIIRRRITNCSGGLTAGVCQNADPSVPPVVVKTLSVRTTELSTIGNSTGAILTVGSARNPDAGPSAPAYVFDTFTNAFKLFLGVTNLGLNTAFSLSSTTGFVPLAPGESVAIEFRLNILRGGSFRFGYAADDDLEPLVGATPKLIDTPTSTPAPSPAATPAPSAPAVTTEIPPASAAAPEGVSGTVSAPVNPAAAQAALAGGSTKPAAKPAAKCLTKRQYKRLKPRQRKRAKLCAPKRPTSKATTAKPRRSAARAPAGLRARVAPSDR